ncbi:MAG: hypothetical protein OXG15_03075 [Gammaproteobacteria bacterium]|nr:hypothetical protein [Gammaproteobacteria bacterium]
MKYKFPPPPNFYGDASGPEIPSRLTHLGILSCDGSGVCVQLEYADGNGPHMARIAMSLPAAVKLSNELSDAVDEYLYETGEEIETT